MELTFYPNEKYPISLKQLGRNPGVNNDKIMINYCRQSLTNLQGSKRKIWFDNIQRIAAQHLCIGLGVNKIGNLMGAYNRTFSLANFFFFFFL